MEPISDGSKRILTVVGAEESGLAAVELLKKHGANVRCSVSGKMSDKARASLKEWGVPFEEDAHRPEFFSGSDAVVVSPGVKPTSPAMTLARSLRVPVWSEIEIAARITRGPWAAVTGSNGKSTTATLLWEMWRRTLPCDLCGNIGKAFARSVLQEPEFARVVEVSSFQLHTIDQARPRAAVILNLSPNHLDWHPDLDDYYSAKFRIAKNMTGEDALILNADDPEILRRSKSICCRKIFYSLHDLTEGWTLRGGRAVRVDSGRERLEVLLDGTRLLGRHNLSNLLAAVAAADFLGVPVPAIEEAVREMKPLLHRLEPVMQWNGIRFVNDSKSTTSLSTMAALRSFESGVILLCGGKRKQDSYKDVLPDIERRVAHLVLYGECAEFLESEFASFQPRTRVKDLPSAFAVALKTARPGQTVLLSPMCSSFDQYRSYAERGEHFKKLVGAKTGSEIAA